MLEVLTPASSMDLVTLADTKAYLGISGTSEDVPLALQISTASQSIQGWLQRPLVEESVRERVFCVSSTLVLQRWPVGTITLLKENDVTLTTDNYLVDVRSGIVYRREVGTFRNLLWEGEIVVEYSAGYATIPSLVKEACYTAIKFYRDAVGRESGVKMERLEGESSVTYFSPTGEGLPAEVTDRLQPYRQQML